MESSRILLDSALGQPWLPAAEAALLQAARSSFAGLAAPYSEGKLSSSLQQSALNSIAKSLDIEISQILPVHNLATAIQLIARICKNQEVSISQTSRSNFRKLLVSACGASEVSVDSRGWENSEIKNWHVTQAGNPETGVIADLDTLGQHCEVLVVDATEWLWRKPDLPAGDLLLLRLQSAGGGETCLIVSRGVELEITEIEKRAAAPAVFTLVAGAIALENLDYSVAANHRLWISEFEGCLQEIAGLQTLETFPALQAQHRLPHLTTFIASSVEAEFLASELDRLGFAVGAGAACGLSQTKSSVLAAMGRQESSNIRIGLPLDSRQSDLEKLLEVLPVALSNCLQN